MLNILLPMPKTDTDDTAMARAREWVTAQGITLHELGIRMGFDESVARQSAFQFLKSKDPRISTLRRFAKAAGVPVEQLVAASKPETKPTKPKK